MTITAAEAKKISEDYLDAMQHDSEMRHKALVAEEKKRAKALWEERGPILITRIESYIKKSAAEGWNGTREPSRVNPNGDSIIYLEGEDRLVKELLMEYFRGQGFTVEDYQYGGLQITW